MATNSSTLAWKTPWMEEPGGLQPMGSQRVGHDGATSLHFTLFARGHLAMSEGVFGFHNWWVLDFPGSPWLRLCASTAGGMGSLSGREVPHAAWCNQKKKKNPKTSGCYWQPVDRGKRCY